MNPSIIYAHEDIDAIGSDITNSFVQVDLQKKEFSERVCIKILVELVDNLIDVAPETYTQYVVKGKHRIVLNVVVLKAIYGILQAFPPLVPRTLKAIKGYGISF